MRAGVTLADAGGLRALSLTSLCLTCASCHWGCGLSYGIDQN